MKVIESFDGAYSRPFHARRPTAHDGTLSPVVRSQYQRQVRPCRRSRCSTTPVSFHLDNAKHTATERLANSFDYAGEHELRRFAGRFTSHTVSAILAHTSTRPDQIAIGATRGPRYRATRFLQRLLMAYAHSPVRCRASQKPHNFPALLKLRYANPSHRTPGE
jgi:hypothetical protein